MTDRVTKVVLRGEVNQFIGSMRASAAGVRSVVDTMTASTKEANLWRQNLTAVGASAGKLGLVAAAGVGVAVRAFANFDQAMSNVKSTGKDAADNIDALTQSAIEWGQKTQYSATEAAGAMAELLKAGVAAKDVLGGGLQGALNLAAAGQLAVADAAQIAATAMVQFGLAGTDVPHIADLLAAAANKAQGEVSDMGQALKYVGPVAHQMGVSIEETTGVIAELASNGILADQAGTSMRGMLLSLTSPSKIAASTMKQLGINVYDTQGNFVGFRGVAEQLQSRMSGLTNAERDQAFGRIFGNEQITTARVLYAGGAKDVDTWTKAVNDQGYAAEVAATKMDNLKGDLEQLRGAFETALIGTGQGANGPLRETVQLLTDLVNAYNALPAPIKTAILAGGALTAGLGGTIFVVSRAIEAQARMRKSLDGLGVSFEKANKKALAARGGMLAVGVGLAALSGPAHKASEDLGRLTDVASAAAIGFSVGGFWGAAIGGGIALLSSMGSSSKSTAVDLDGLTATLDTQTGAVTKNTAAWVAKSFQDSGTSALAAAAGLSLNDLTEAALGNADAMDKVKSATKDLPGFLRDDLVGAVESMSGSLDDATQSQKDAAEAGGQASESIAEVGTSADAAADDVKALKDAIDGLLDPLLSQEDASNAWKDSLASLSEEVKKNAKTLDDSTTVGRANQNSIRDRVKALKESAQADLDAGGSQEEFSRKLVRGREKIIDAAVAAGFSRKEVKKYIAQLGLTPEQIKTVINADTADALAKVRRLQGFIDGMHGKTVKVHVEGGTPGGITVGSYMGGAIPRATGGSVLGPGTATSDSIPASGPGGFRYRLSNGEHVLSAADVDALGGQQAVYAMRAALHSQKAAIQNRSYGYSGGGSVGSAVSGPEFFRLVDTRVTFDQSGLRLIDDRIQKVTAGDNNYRASKVRPKGPR